MFNAQLIFAQGIEHMHRVFLFILHCVESGQHHIQICIMNAEVEEFVLCV